jgi:hypothetical protein
MYRLAISALIFRPLPSFVTFSAPNSRMRSLHLHLQRTGIDVIAFGLHVFASSEVVSSQSLPRTLLLFHPHSICRVKQVTCTATQYESEPQSLARPRGKAALSLSCHCRERVVLFFIYESMPSSAVCVLSITQYAKNTPHVAPRRSTSHKRQLRPGDETARNAHSYCARPLWLLMARSITLLNSSNHA